MADNEQGNIGVSSSRAESSAEMDRAAEARGIKSVRDLSEVQRDVKGEVIATSSDHVLLKASEDIAVKVEKADLDREPKVGERITIQYDREQSKVHEQGQETDRNQAREAARDFGR